MSDDEIDNRIEIESVSLAKSQNCPGNMIYWDKNMCNFWVMFGHNGLEFCGSSAENNIYSIIGVDII
jgi:hypothetical protein